MAAGGTLRRAADAIGASPSELDLALWEQLGGWDREVNALLEGSRP